MTKRVRQAVWAAMCAALALSVMSGCIKVKTEHEVKPIHITMDVNLKVQKELEDFLNLDN